MQVLNFGAKFTIGTVVVVKKEYTNSSISLCVGMQGMIYKITIEDVPDMGLFNLRILHMNFNNQKLNMEESLARGYFKVA